MRKGIFCLAMVVSLAFTVAACKKSYPAPTPEQVNDFVRAAGFGKIDDLKKLYDENPRVLDMIKQDDDDTALIAAVRNQRIDVIDFLLARGANVNQLNSQKRSALETAVFTQDLALIEKLIAAGADVNNKNDWGTTPLAYAEDKNLTEVAELLKKHGAVR